MKNVRYLSLLYLYSYPDGIRNTDQSSGGSSWIRTSDHLLKRQLLYQAELWTPELYKEK